MSGTRPSGPSRPTAASSAAGSSAPPHGPRRSACSPACSTRSRSRTSLPEQGDEALHDCRLAEDGAEESVAVRYREVPDDGVAAARLLNQNLARRQIPDLVVHVDRKSVV